jgi:hypothetical protein
MKTLRFFAALFGLAAAFTTYAQERRPPAVGIIMQMNRDPVERIDAGQGIRGEYATQREMFGAEVLYGVAPRWGMRSAAGLAFYTSKLPLAPLENTFRKENQISATALSFSQTLLYDLWSCRTADRSLRFSLSPYAALTYSHTLKGAGEKALVTGSSAPEAATGRRTTPSDAFSVAAGIEFEMRLFGRLGMFYALGYTWSPAGHSSFDLDYQRVGRPSTVNRTSRDAGPIHSLGGRWYIK